MTYQFVIVALKGSSLSGNFGHSGRPGRLGGSQPGGGHGAIGLTSAEVRAAALAEYRRAKREQRASEPPVNSEPPLGKDTDFHNKAWLLANKLHDTESALLGEWLGIDTDAAKALVGKAFSYHDDATGMSTIMDEYFRSGEDRISVNGTIYSKDGDQLGRFERTFVKTGSDVSVIHEYFKLEDAAQGTGFGSRLYQHAEDTYKQGGIKQVNMQANLEVGGYAWARVGFDFVKPAEKVHYNERFNNAHIAKYGTPAPIKNASAYEIAAYVGPDGTRPGKAALIGTKTKPVVYEAVKILDETNPGYQVGQAYYKTKGKK